MRVLVTGGAGFIGRHVCTRLLAAGHSVSVLDNLSTGRADLLPDRVRLIFGDVASPDMAAFLAQERPDAIVHLAAQISVSHSVANPLVDERANIRGTLNLLSAVGAVGVHRLVFASSAAVYGIPKVIPLQEDATTAPLSPYGLSKATAEAYIRMLADTSGIAYTILRFANVYGPGQMPEGEAGVVAIFCDRALQGTPPVIHGDGKQTRDFVYVGDVAEAVALAVESPRTGDVLHVSSGDATTINDLWETVRHVASDLVGPGQVALIRELRAKPGPERSGDIRHSVLDNSRIRAALGWSPRTTLLQGLTETLRSLLPGEEGERHA